MSRSSSPVRVPLVVATTSGHALAPHLVGDAHDGGVGYAGVRQQDILDLGRMRSADRSPPV